MELREYLDSFTRRDWRETSDAGPLRFAMVGLGWWTREQAIPAVADSELCETTTVVSGSKEKAESATELAASIEHPLTYEEFRAGRASGAYDAVYVCTPNATHLDYVETAAELGKAVLCEKPMEATVQRARALVEACERTDVPLQIAYRMHTEPAARRAKALLAEGFLGDVVSVHGHMSQRLLEANPNLDQWRLDSDLTGYGTSIMDIGVYPINTTRFLLEADPVAVQGATASVNEAFDEVPDERAAFTLEFPDHVYAVCTASQNAQRSSHLLVTGTEGEVRIDPAFFHGQPVSLQVTRGDVAIDHTYDQPDQMREEFDCFADRVLRGAEIYADGEHGLVDMAVIAAIHEAAERGERVEC